MRIKRLELYGFKSFPGKTILQFPPGISAIVGPNGSGKSNIVDALRWILGEQSPRLLRVREMGDLIFSGENGRRPEFAEVSLILENEEGKSPKDFARYPEISVKRRLYRDGESEFYLNGRPCRLKDIVYLFLDTGVHARGYGIIDQGQVGQFVEQSPRERRRFLEELAGIARYKLKKEETERQLLSSRENLVRIKDIIFEVRERLKELEAQAQKAEAYLKLKEEFRNLTLSRLHILYQQNKSVQEKLLTRLKEWQQEVESYQSEKEALDPEKEKTLAEIEILREKIKILKDNLRKKEEEFSILERELTDLIKEERNFSHQITRFKERLNNIEQAINDLKKRLKEVRKEKERALKEITKIREKIDLFEKQSQEVYEKKNKIEREINSLKEKIFSIKHHTKILEQEKSRLEEEISSQEDLKKKINEEKKRIYIERENISKKKKEILLEEEKIITQEKDIFHEREEKEKMLEEKKNYLSKLQEEISFLNLKQKELQQEVKWLKDFLENFLSQAAQILKEEGLEVLSLYQAVKLNPQEEKLAELAFPEIITALWIKEERRERALEILLSHKCPALIYLGNDPTDFLKKKIEGLKLVKNPNFEEKGPWVSEEGIFLEKDALLHLPGKEDRSLFTKRRKLKEKEKELNYTQILLYEKRKEKENLERDIQKISEKIRSIKQKEEEIQKKVSEIQKQKQYLEIKAEKLKQQEDIWKEREREANSKIKKYQEKLEDLKEKISNLYQEKEKISLLFQKKEEEGKIFNKEAKAARANLRALELSLSAAKEREKQASKEEIRILKEEKKLAEEKEKIRSFLFEIENKYQDLKNKIKVAQEKKEREKKEISLLKSELAKLQEEFLQKENLLQKISARLEALSGEISKREKQINRYEIDLAEAKLRCEHLKEQAQQLGAQIPLSEFSSDLSLGEIEKALSRLKGRLENFGPVNLAAIEEQRKIKERLDFLRNQKKDIEKAISDLESAVRQINQTCRTRLREALAAANEKLEQVFPLLFPGGKAFLRFTEEDPLSAGLDLLIRLPGKPVRHLAMLSGGEKALTALAVLCAFYLVKPGPFCVLDEVDAPLDEVNTRRFVNLLRELNKHSQVILVTHNKIVMEAADSLIGVTMEEKGVSKIVSVSLS